MSLDRADRRRMGPESRSNKGTMKVFTSTV